MARKPEEILREQIGGLYMELAMRDSRIEQLKEENAELKKVIANMSLQPVREPDKPDKQLPNGKEVKQ